MDLKGNKDNKNETVEFLKLLFCIILMFLILWVGVSGYLDSLENEKTPEQIEIERMNADRFIFDTNMMFQDNHTSNETSYK